MKATSLGLALLVAAVEFVSVTATRAQERGGRQSLEAKLEYCKTCHGLSGEGYRGYYPMPRLAGQQPKYFEAQLRAFIEHRRVNPVMFNVAHELTPATVSALATHFHNLNPPPLGGAPKENIALGRTIFEQGLPESNIAACSACHGPDARGHEEIPRLAGQLYPYTVRSLTLWGRERGQGAKTDTAAIMVVTTHNLSAAQISAIAAYLAYLK
ncbi:cytochrome c (plasmid) [Methylocystis sp. MJC1]|jgi:cytochrome c553|uniref:c-type cytochrome n=1 Tax=Methylocystis sp. MJC1 TaxID=2654282 RepID=UPI0013EA681F|nr:c-type cytochrome [Methylocystis sp. MJC1]KAF2991486.1 Cytochrome c-552 [Methylocystis sp. MJC1]MBU6529200.1 c-type cytochrome [Methylocystis sp. MJC1]UZX13880.1 cytochrome c [Methylocystis sp. MJC1]